VFKRLKAIAFTDSVHSVSLRESERIKTFFTTGQVSEGGGRMVERVCLWSINGDIAGTRLGAE
jgi:hypothetical protein